MRQPAAAEVTSALRVGSDVYVTVSVPTANVDGSTPASVRQIEVWGATAATPPPLSQFVAMATLVATIQVARYADPADRSGTVVPDPKTGALQGASVTVRDSLTADEMQPRTPAAKEAGSPAAAPAPEALRRYYLTIPLSDRKRPGPPSKPVDVPLTSVPDRVAPVTATMKGRTVVVEWEPSGGVVGFLLGRALPVEPSPVDERPAAAAAIVTAGEASGPTLYNVYRELGPDPLALPVIAAADVPWAATPQSPANAKPLTTLNFVDEDVQFDERQRCYHVRAVSGTGAQRVESEPSSRVCIVPVDTEPPAAVTNLSASSVEGQIVLRWDPNGEEDLRGYIVLRRAAGDDTLQQLTRTALAKTGYTDTEVMSGQTYTYVVQAVDNRLPVPNVSDPSDTTATAR